MNMKVHMAIVKSCFQSISKECWVLHSDSTKHVLPILLEFMGNLETSATETSFHHEASHTIMRQLQKVNIIFNVLKSDWCGQHSGDLHENPSKVTRRSLPSRERPRTSATSLWFGNRFRMVLRYLKHPICKDCVLDC